MMKKVNKTRKEEFYNVLRSRDNSHVTDFGPSARTRYRIILKHIRELSGPKTKILDSGMGTGSFVKILSNKGYNVEGCDFSSEALKIARQYLPKDTNIFKADLTDFNTLDFGVYDLIVNSEVLEHIKDDSTVLANLFKILKDDGFIIITVPFSMKHWSHADTYTGHYRRYEPGELNRKLEEAGFSIVENYVWGGFVYSVYYKFIKKGNPEKIRSEKYSFLKSLLSFCLYYFFFIDDLFIFSRKGLREVIIAKK